MEIVFQIEGFKIGYALTKTPIMKSLNATLHPISIPECSHLPHFSDEHLICQAKHYTLTIYHPVSKILFAIHVFNHFTRSIGRNL